MCKTFDIANPDSSSHKNNSNTYDIGTFENIINNDKIIINPKQKVLLTSESRYNRISDQSYTKLQGGPKT